MGPARQRPCRRRAERNDEARRDDTPLGVGPPPAFAIPETPRLLGARVIPVMARPWSSAPAHDIPDNAAPFRHSPA